MMIFLQTILQITHINQLPVVEIYSIPPTTTLCWMAEVYWTLMDKHEYKRTQGVISVHAHIVENTDLINWSNCGYCSWQWLTRCLPPPALRRTDPQGRRRARGHWGGLSNLKSCLLTLRSGPWRCLHQPWPAYHGRWMPAYSFYMDACSRGRRAMKLPTDRTAVASIKRSNHCLKSKNLSDSIIFELLDWTMNLKRSLTQIVTEDTKNIYFELFIYLCWLAPLQCQILKKI